MRTIDSIGFREIANMLVEERRDPGSIGLHVAAEHP